MARCIKTTTLEVHHKRRDGGNDISNAEVLCSQCHEETLTYGLSGKTPEDFSEKTKQEALSIAENQ